MKFDPKTELKDSKGAIARDNLLAPILIGEQIANGILRTPAKAGESASKKMRLAIKLVAEKTVDVSDEEKKIIDDTIHNGEFTVLFTAQAEEIFGLDKG